MGLRSKAALLGRPQADGKQDRRRVPITESVGLGDLDEGRDLAARPMLACRLFVVPPTRGANAGLRIGGWAYASQTVAAD